MSFNFLEIGEVLELVTRTRRSPRAEAAPDHRGCLEAERLEQMELRVGEESIYLFGNILLDRIALAVKHTLLRGETKMSRHSRHRLQKLAAEHDLDEPPRRLLELATMLETELSDVVRDKLIVHATGPGHVRVAVARMFNLETGESVLMPFVTNPRNELENEARPGAGDHDDDRSAVRVPRRSRRLGPPVPDFR